MLAGSGVGGFLLLLAVGRIVWCCTKQKQQKEILGEQCNVRRGTGEMMAKSINEIMESNKNNERDSRSV